jgi:hypothetical protein
MCCTYDDEDDDKPIIHFYMDNPTIDEETIFESVVDCRHAYATFAIKFWFDYITRKSNQKIQRVHFR